MIPTYQLHYIYGFRFVFFSEKNVVNRTFLYIVGRERGERREERGERREAKREKYDVYISRSKIIHNIT